MRPIWVVSSLLLFLLSSLGFVARPAVAAEKIPVIYDSDTGDDIDDTWALVMLLKSPQFDVKLVSTDCHHARSRAKIQATFPAKLDSGATIPFTWGSTSPLASPNGLLLMAKGPDPLGQHDFVLIGRETAAVELFRVGASLEEGVYYFWYAFGDKRGAYWGRNAYAGAAGAGGMPVNPHDLLAVLNVSMMPDDLTELPAVALAMRTTPGEYAYVVTHIDRDPITRQIIFRRETLLTWSDEERPRPFEMNFFDANGLRVMTAKLKDYKLIAADPPAKTYVVMPTDIEIVWPEADSRMHIVLSEMSTKAVPPEVFRFSDHAPALPGEKVVQVDSGITAGGAGP